MNIWHWLAQLESDLHDAGQAHQAKIIDDLSSHVAELEVEKCEALLPEVKALAHTLENPWLSVYIGHWEMRNRLGNKKEGETALADVVELFEFANRDDTQDCPQSICVTQDLSACYGNIDGIGWANERIAVCDETLARIDPTWACYQCLNCEKAIALLDIKQPEQALVHLQHVSQQLTDAGEDIGPGIKETLNDVSLALGKYDDVLNSIEQEEQRKREYREWKNTVQPRTLRKVRALVGLGRDDDALDALPNLSSLNDGDIFAWLKSIHPVLLRRPELNTWELAERVQRGLDHLSTYQAHRDTIEMAALSIELAIARQAKWVAQRQMNIALNHLDKLRVDGGASELLATLQQQIDAMPAVELPVEASQLYAWLEQQGDENPEQERNPEQELIWISQARQSLPDDEYLLRLHAIALRACGADKDAVPLLKQFVAKHPDSSVRFMLLDLLLNQMDSNHAIAQLAEPYKHDDELFYHWCHARLAYQQDNWTQAEQSLKALLVHKDDAISARDMLAHSLMRQQKFADAAEQYLRLSELDGEDVSHQWDYMVASSAEQNWQNVRKMALLLEIEMPEDDGQRPDENWGIVIIRYIEDGEARDYYARRLGPCHAMILENAVPKHPQHVADVVVFDPRLIYPRPESEEEQENFIASYHMVHCIEQGNYRNSVFMDGVHPTEQQLADFKEKCQAKDWITWIHSNSEYQVTDSEDGQEYAGMMMTIAVPQQVSPLQIHQFLLEHTADWQHAMCWYRLAEMAGADTAKQKAIIERYGL
ncbi:heme biosynthesis protein HemY [Acinetobacter sp. c3-l95]|uniref:heme biosynthesis protein HemY n=1 Tax=Acinetobacter sp. c3-l95 TaxID=3342804 RepID=UPI0035BB96AC